MDVNTIGYICDGLGGLNAVGGSRLLFECPDKFRSQRLDLLFKPNYGANWQILKSEINGDIQSLYGSGSSFMHYTNETNPNQWNRGTHHWFVKEALNRNSNMKLYLLLWGMPYWVGNDTYLL